MADDARLEKFRVLWTEYLADYILLEHPDKSVVVCNRDTQMPLMIEEESLRDAVTQKFIIAGIEHIKASE